MEDIQQAVKLDPTLKTHDLVTGIHMDTHIHVNIVACTLIGKGLPYMPAVASLAATHKGKIKNIRAAMLKVTKEERNPGVVILSFEDETIAYDKHSKEQLGSLGMYIHIYICI